MNSGAGVLNCDLSQEHSLKWLGLPDKDASPIPGKVKVYHLYQTVLCLPLASLSACRNWQPPICRCQLARSPHLRQEPVPFYGGEIKSIFLVTYDIESTTLFLHV
jgi:hypothetical protein